MSTWKRIGGNYVSAYLIAIVAANITITILGPNWSALTAFVAIGLDLTARDRLHELWGRWMPAGMAVLIASGSGLSYLLNSKSGRIAVASLSAFCIAAIVDTVAYSILHERKYLARVNGSNMFSALVDSFLFPTIAFGAFMPAIILGQFVAKWLGGFVWSLLLVRNSHNQRQPIGGS